MFVDFHIHSRFAYRTSKYISFQGLLKRKKEVGLDLIGTGDIFHPLWRQEVKNYKKHLNCEFVLTTEICVIGKSHVLLIFNDFKTVEKYYRLFSKLSKDINTNGRPHINVSLEQLIAIKNKNKDFLIGLAHAFSYNGGYLYNATDIPNVDFIQLGLDFAPAWLNSFKTITTLPLVKFSDAHSLIKIGRQCTEIDLTIPFSITKFKSSLDKIELISGIPTIGRFYESGKKAGVKQTIQRLISKELPHSHINCRLPLLDTIAYANNRPTSSKYVLAIYQQKIRLKPELQYFKEIDSNPELSRYMFPKLTNIYRYGSEGNTGKLKYEP